MTGLEILKRARARIADPKRWTQGANARDANGDTTSPFASDAVCWCASGALFVEGYGAETTDEAKSAYRDLRDKLYTATQCIGIIKTNDLGSPRDGARTRPGCVRRCNHETGGKK